VIGEILIVIGALMVLFALYGPLRRLCARVFRRRKTR
jgi:hypothetical protein